MRLVYRYWFFELCIVLCLCACTSQTPHENFIATMRSDIGKKTDDPTLSGWLQSGRLVERKTLPNGNIEEEYRFKSACRYFYEISPTTSIIVGWRFSGSERECEINP